MSKYELPVTLHFQDLSSDEQKASLAVISLSRASHANAFNEAMIKGLTNCFKSIRNRSDCRALILRGLGKHFSAGADLNWMKDSAKLPFQKNVDGATKMQQMFESLYTLPIPTIAVAHGAAYGGAVGLVAACDYAIGISDVKFCLSEVKVGLIPAVILPYLKQKMRPAALKRLSLTGRVFNAAEALEWGLIEKTCIDDELDEVLRAELNEILTSSPKAQTALKQLYRDLGNSNQTAPSLTSVAIATIRKSEEAQAGLSAFFEKKTPPWKVGIETDWKLDDQSE